MNHVLDNQRRAVAAPTHRSRRRLTQISLCALVAMAVGVPSAQAGLNVHSGNPLGAPFDSDVKITAETPSLGSLGRPANLVPQYTPPAWHAPFPGSSWVSSSTIPGGYGFGATYTRFTIAFNVPLGATGLKLTGSYYADNRATVLVNGLTVPESSTSGCLVSTFNGPPKTYTTTSLLHTGSNTLSFDVTNCGGPNGVDFNADVTWTDGPPGPSELDHFKCYTVKPTSPKTRAVTLSDQFGVKKSSVREVRELCNPVDKVHKAPPPSTSTTSDMRHPQAHLVCRRTVDKGSVVARKVRLRNQFGIMDTVTTGSQTLCLPSLKRKLKGPHGPAPTGKNPEKVLDHFRCYGVQPRQVSVGKVKLSDQFGSGAVQVIRLVKLCNPVRKTFKGKVSKIKYLRAHLACYTIKDTMPFQPRWVSTRNQFGVRKLHVLRAQTLCLPTFKELLKTKIVDEPVDATPVLEAFAAGLTVTSCNEGEQVVHTVRGATNPAHPFGTATGVLTGGLEAFPAQTVALGADGTWTAQVKTPRNAATYSWDWTVTDIDEGKASASIPVIVKPENPRC